MIKITVIVFFAFIITNVIESQPDEDYSKTDEITESSDLNNETVWSTSNDASSSSNNTTKVIWSQGNIVALSIVVGLFLAAFVSFCLFCCFCDESCCGKTV